VWFDGYEQAECLPTTTVITITIIITITIATANATTTSLAESDRLVQWG
jgi:hypothetical protein